MDTLRSKKVNLACYIRPRRYVCVVGVVHLRDTL